MAHRGAYSGIATFAPMMVTSFSYLFREQPSPPEAYYGAWFFIPASLQVRSWLSLHHFGYHRSAGAAETTPLWDFNVYPGPDGNLIAHLYDVSGHGELRTRRTRSRSRWRQWVHFEIFFRKAADATGRITIWQDGVQILDHAEHRDRSDRLVQWDVGRRVERHRAVAGDGLFRRRDDQFDARVGIVEVGMIIAPTEGFGPGFPSIRNWFRCALNACFPRAAAIAHA